MNLSNESIFLILGLALITGMLALNVGNALYSFDKVLKD